MEKKELEVFNKVISEKYKYHKLWKFLAFIFMALTILFGTLYFATGEVFKETINNNDIKIINENSGNNYAEINVSN